MEFKLTSKYKYSYHDKDGRDRNYISFYLNDILLLKQKIPFDRYYENGFDRITSIYDVHLLNGKLYQKRSKNPDKSEVRQVSFPISKKILNQFNIPKNLQINTY